jgi:hypothetical protein
MFDVVAGKLYLWQALQEIVHWYLVWNEAKKDDQGVLSQVGLNFYQEALEVSHWWWFSGTMHSE